MEQGFEIATLTTNNGREFRQLMAEIKGRRLKNTVSDTQKWTVEVEAQKIFIDKWVKLIKKWAE